MLCSNLMTSCFRIPRIVVLGGTGFLGRRLAQELHARLGVRPIYVVHRKIPDWLSSTPASIELHGLADLQGIRRTLTSSDIVINLLRPDGTGWYIEALRPLLAVLTAARVRRIIHVSSIDVYGKIGEPLVSEETTPLPETAYAREHLDAERSVLDLDVHSIVLRLGAVFGPGGRNVVAFAREALSASDWRLKFRRILYARRRMHLVSIDAVCGTIAELSTDQVAPSTHGIVLVIDDDDERNNFAFLQDTLSVAFGRKPIDSVLELPEFVLKILLQSRGIPSAVVGRRFSTTRWQAIYRTRPDFAERLAHYAQWLAENRSVWR
jgi:nucleoside-diphosphate-sugar epimerase